MKISQIQDALGFVAVNLPEEDREISSVFCCDLLSLAMSRAPADCAWVTVMGNVNTAAVALLADVSCIILAEGVMPDQGVKETAEAKGINILSSKESAYEIAKALHELGL